MKNIKSILQESISVKNKILSDDILIERINSVVDIITNALSNGNKLILAGNGGSAADAQHITAEFIGKFLKSRKALPAICLNTNVSALTAISNDLGYENVFLRQTQALAQCGDVFLGFTTSGNSKNLVEAFNYASAVDVTCVAFTGENGGEIAEYSNLVLNVPASSTPRIQEAHITIGHIICELVEKNLFE